MSDAKSKCNAECNAEGGACAAENARVCAAKRAAERGSAVSVPLNRCAFAAARCAARLRAYDATSNRNFEQIGGKFSIKICMSSTLSRIISPKLA